MFEKFNLGNFFDVNDVELINANLVNGVMKVECVFSKPGKFKEFSLNIKQPSAKDAPMLLNEDSDF